MPGSAQILLRAGYGHKQATGGGKVAGDSPSLHALPLATLLKYFGGKTEAIYFVGGAFEQHEVDPRTKLLHVSAELDGCARCRS